DGRLEERLRIDRGGVFRGSVARRHARVRERVDARLHGRGVAGGEGQEEGGGQSTHRLVRLLLCKGRTMLANDVNTRKYWIWRWRQQTLGVVEWGIETLGIVGSTVARAGRMGLLAAGFGVL